ncbi:MAG TPA: hypothetical protein DHU55_09105 [Blastocatellia bacterium]|nr:hypothetical protein [Blastocatellia bacterium]HCX29907.1 hypothetical protein [Blastocatellia bacterium]
MFTKASALPPAQESIGFAPIILFAADVLLQDRQCRHREVFQTIFTGDSQHITFEGLTPGANYTVQVCALGRSTGQSDWSDPSSHMAM